MEAFDPKQFEAVYAGPPIADQPVWQPDGIETNSMANMGLGMQPTYPQNFAQLDDPEKPLGFCTSCGAAIYRIAKFCFECGAPLPDELRTKTPEATLPDMPDNSCMVVYAGPDMMGK